MAIHCPWLYADTDTKKPGGLTRRVFRKFFAGAKDLFQSALAEATIQLGVNFFGSSGM